MLSKTRASFYISDRLLSSAAKSLSAARRGLRERTSGPGGKSKDVLLRVQQLRVPRPRCQSWKDGGCSSREEHGENTGGKEGNTPRVEKGFPPIYDRAGYVSNCETVKQKVAAKQKIDPLRPRLSCRDSWPPFATSCPCPRCMIACPLTLTPREKANQFALFAWPACCPHHRGYYNFSW